MNPSIYSQLIFSKVAKNTQWKRTDLSTNGVEWKRMKIETHNITSKWITHLSLRHASMKLLETNTKEACGICPCDYLL